MQILSIFLFFTLLRPKNSQSNELMNIRGQIMVNGINCLFFLSKPQKSNQRIRNEQRPNHRKPQKFGAPFVQRHLPHPQPKQVDLVCQNHFAELHLPRVTVADGLTPVTKSKSPAVTRPSFWSWNPTKRRSNSREK